MPEELGKIEKPSAESFKSGRKLYFIPLVLSGKEMPEDFAEKYKRYWEQVESQITGLELRLGNIKHIFHELLPKGGDEGLKDLEQMGVDSIRLIRSRIGFGSTLEAVEDPEILAELMDWSRCLSIGLQSQAVYARIYQFYAETNQKRSDYISQKINETIKADESAILIMGEGHHVRFDPDIQVFYVSPPALDEIKRWIRDYEAQAHASAAEPQEPPAKPGPDIVQP